MDTEMTDVGDGVLPGGANALSVSHAHGYGMHATGMNLGGNDEMMSMADAAEAARRDKIVGVFAMISAVHNVISSCITYTFTALSLFTSRELESCYCNRLTYVTELIHTSPLLIPIRA